MAEIESRLPLLVKGFNFDQPGALAAATNLRGQMLSNEGAALNNRGQAMQNDLASMELSDATAKFGALNDFRAARSAGDANATDKLSAFPDMQLQMEQTLNGLDEQDRLDAVASARNVADAARRVQGFPEGSDEQKAAWNAEVENLVEAGDLSEEAADSYRDNFSPLVLDQALRLGETLEQYIQRQDAAAAKKLTDAQARPTSYDDLTLSQKLEIDKQATDKVKAIIGNSIRSPDPEEAQTMFESARNDVLQSLGLKPPSTSVTPPPTEGAGGAESALPAPAGKEQATPAEVDWTTLTPDAQEEAVKMLVEGAASPADRASAIAEFNAMFGEGMAEAVLKGR